MYNIALVLGGQHSVSVKYIFILLRVFAEIGYYRILCRVPCALQ